MAIELVAGHAERLGEFLALPHRLYAGDGRWIPAEDAVLRRWLCATDSSRWPSRLATSAHFIARAGRRTLARISAFINDSLADVDGSPVGALGLFESEDDSAVAEDLIGTAREWLAERAGVSRAWGPLNLDIWHGYRCMTQGFDAEPFAGEPYNKRYYPELLQRTGAQVRFTWNSFEADGGDRARVAYARGLEQRACLAARGYRFEAFDGGRVEDELRKLHGLVIRSFARFPAFTPITADEFCSLTRPLAQALVPGGACFVLDPEHEYCGFAVAMLDLATPLRLARTAPRASSGAGAARRTAVPDRVLIELVGVTPEAAKSCPGLGRALVTEVLGNLIGAGYVRYVAPLISQGNVSRGLAGATVALNARRYALFEWRA
jgi:hypothetical protein